MRETDTRSRLGRRSLTVWFAQAVSSIGTIVSGIGVAVYTFVETGSAAWLGVLAALASVPYVITAPLLTLTDRFTRRSVMIAADVFAAVGPAAALVFAVAGRLEIWHLDRAGARTGGFVLRRARRRSRGGPGDGRRRGARGFVRHGDRLGIGAGAALVLAVVGLGLAMIGTWLARSWI